MDGATTFPRLPWSTVIEIGTTHGSLDRARGPLTPDLRFAGLLHHTSDAVLLVAGDGRVVEVNPAAVELLGASATDLSGRAVAELAVGDEVPSLVGRLARGDEVVSARESWFGRPDGSRFRAEIVGHPVGDGYVQLLLRDLSGRAAAARSARGARERLRLAAECAGFGTWDLDVARGRVEWSPQIFEIVGLPTGTPVDPHTLASLVHPDDRVRVGRVLSGATEASGTEEFRVVRPSGEVRWVRHTRQADRAGRSPEGAVARVVGTLFDITEQRRTEEALRRSEARFHQALRGSLVVVATQDRRLRYTWVHNPAPSFVEERLGRTDADLLPEVDAATVTRVKQAVLETGLPAREEVHLVGRGEVRDHLLSVEPLKDEGGMICGVSVVEIDLTEQNRTATALRESEERLRLAMEGARMFSVDADLATGINHYSRNAARVLGYARLPEAFEDRVTWLSVIHPDDLDRVRAGQARLLETGEVSIEYRVLAGDGYRWLGAHHTLVRDAAGSPVRVIGMAQDVTERKRSEQAARARELASLARLHAIAMRAVEDDLSGLFGEIVDAAIGITGADMGVLQVRDPRTGELEIVAQRGFEARLEQVAAIERGRASMGTLALALGERVVVEDLATRPAFLPQTDLRALLAAGVRAAQATPLATRSGDILGALSIHYREPRPRDDQDLPALNLLARLSADLLEQRRLMDELRAADRRNREFLAAVAEPVVIIDQRGRIAYANGQAERVFGYGPGELDGQPHALLLPERLRLLHVLHTLRFVTDPRARTLGPELPQYGRRKDGSEFPIEVSVNPIPTASGTMVSTVVRDIGERKRLEAAAQLHAERLASAIESITDPIAVWDTADRLAACNSAFRDLVTPFVPGPTPGGLTGAELDARVAPALVFSRDEERMALVKGGGVSRIGGADLHFLDGRRLRVSTREMPGGGRVTVAIDLTEDLRQKHALELARSEAEAASRAKSEFLASMSHELRTPLNAVLGFCQLLQRDRKEPLTDRQREMVGLAYRGGEHLLHLIDDALDLARIEANRVSIKLEPVSVVDAIGETVDALEPTANQAGVGLRFEPPEADPPAVDADPRRLVQILMNYGSNAVKYNRRGGSVGFHVTLPRPGVVRVTVADTGAGIPSEHRSRLFEPFQRAGQETGPVQGTGIGLAISKRLAELMGGRVGFESSQGTGSAFWVELPEARVRPRATPAPAPPRPALEVRPALVVYIEDNPASVAFMRAALEAIDGVGFLSAESAEQGLALIGERRPDLVFMDVNLPGMGGLEALERLQLDPRTRDIPVVAVTAAASTIDRERGEQAGFHRYLTKPVAMDELESVLEKFLPTRR